MSVKKKLLISAIIMLTVPAVLIVILSVLLVGIFTFLNPTVELSFHSGVSISNPAVIRLIVVWGIMAVIIVLTTGLCIASYIGKSVLRPLNNLSEALEHMKNGDLDFEFVGSGDEEIRKLCSSFEDLRLRLQKNVRLNLEKENEQKMLLANISHDIKTPITAIKGYVEGIKDGIAETPEKQQHYLDTIHAKADAIGQMAENLSIYSKLELGRVQYNKTETDIFEFLAKVAKEFELDLQVSQTMLELDISNETAVMLIDSEKMRRVFANIITNAIKYKKSGQGILKISGKKDENGIIISFADNGRGIAEKDIPHIFDGFYRGDPSRNSKIEGNGLGLSISRRIVNDHGGKIWIRSHEGDGCEVNISFVI